jgi:hypothetical protein
VCAGKEINVSWEADLSVQGSRLRTGKEMNVCWEADLSVLGRRLVCTGKQIDLCREED